MNGHDPVGPGAAGANGGPPVSASEGAAARPALILAGLAVSAFGLLILFKVAEIRQPAGYMIIGPRVLPTVIGGILLVLGVAFTAQSVAGRDSDLAATVSAERSSGSPLVAISLVAALVVYARVLVPVGYVVSTAAFLPVTARLLGSRRPLRDVTVGVVLAVAAFECFTRLLEINLPAGILGDVL